MPTARLFLGDPESVKVPVAGLTSKSYAAALRAQIDPARARPSSDIRAGDPAPREGDNTTHFSVIDRDGNAVSNTYTLNLSYGVGMIADGTGVLLNNELDDFAAKPMAPNAYGLVGAEANAPGPGKRPLSSMTPTIVLKDGKPFVITGSPGGSRIITTVLQIVTNVIDGGMTLAESVTAPRLHHQWLPDQVVAEPGVAPDLIQALQARGHRVVGRTQCHLGEFYRGHGKWLCRRGGCTHARRSSGGILELRSGGEAALRRHAGFHCSPPGGWARRKKTAATGFSRPAPSRPSTELPQTLWKKQTQGRGS